MLRTREFVEQGMRWKIGNGHTISFWLDNWCHESPMVELLALGPSAHDISQVKVSEFITSTNLWDTDKLSQVLPQNLVSLVLVVLIPLTNMEDSLCWGFKGSEDFITKSTTWRAHDNIIHDQDSWKFNWIWKLDVMSKIKIFLWQLCRTFFEG